MVPWRHIGVRSAPGAEYLSLRGARHARLGSQGGWFRRGTQRRWAPDAIAGLYRGDNNGKRLIRIAA